MKTTHVEGIFQIEIVGSVEVTANEFVDFRLALGVKILEFVHRLELDDIKTVGEDAVRFSLEEMLALVGGDVGDSGEDVGAVGGGTLDAVAMVDAALACFMVNVKVLEVVVEVDGAGAEVSTKEGCVGGKDGGDIDMALPTQGYCETGLPLVEVGNDSSLELPGNILRKIKRSGSQRMITVGRMRT